MAITIMDKSFKLSNKKQKIIDDLLINATISGNIEEMRKYIGEGASGKAVDEGGFTALMWAARYDLEKAVSLLLPESDLTQVEKQGRTALDIAKEGAGEKSISALYIESYLLALAEVKSLTEIACVAPKSIHKKFRL